MNMTVRLEEMELEDFKNVRHGKFQMPSALKKETRTADILGIYGQNGSGKTAVIDAFCMLQRILCGKALEDDAASYINVDSSKATISLTLRILDSRMETLGLYTYRISVASKDGKAFIDSEILSVRKKQENGYGREKVLIRYEQGSLDFKPEATFKRIVKASKNTALDLMVASRMAERTASSFIFGRDGGFDVFSRLEGDFKEDYAMPISTIRSYAETSLVVLSTRESGIGKDDKLHLSFQKKNTQGMASLGQLTIDLRHSQVLTIEEEKQLRRMIKEMNTVLSAIVPHLELGLYTAGEELTDSGKKGVRIEIVSLKNGKAIPLRFESEGIIKIISILNILLCVYNNPSVCLVIDEFDASIFEYLLGELISVFSQGAKGQMIFTSHNLRILEMIDKDSVIFSTSNPDNRYIRMTNIKNTNNLRDVYIRSILLGGTKENIYEETDSHEIGMALRKAWREDEEK